MSVDASLLRRLLSKLSTRDVALDFLSQSSTFTGLTTVPPPPTPWPGGKLKVQMVIRKKEANGSRYSRLLNTSMAPQLEENLPPTLLEEPNSGSETTALKWVLRCCPELPRSLVHKLFRLRQVAAKDLLNIGDGIFLPISVQDSRAQNQELHRKQEGHWTEEVNFVRSLALYKDSAVIVINKPSGMPFQGGIRIKRSLDEPGATCVRYDHLEPPRLVHRLDRDSSGILVMGRMQTSATVLHSILSEKTSSVSKDVVVDDGKSERITVIEKTQSIPSQHAITEYQVIKSTSLGHPWLELSPLTGRKHQVLGTPIVGDYKYGWQAHRKWQHFPLSNIDKDSNQDSAKENSRPFGLNLESGSICEKHPRLHLHCQKMILPNVPKALQSLQSSDYDLSKMESLELAAPLPAFMQKNWDILNS